MATPIQDPAELQELIDLLDAEGLHVPGDVQTVEELIRYLLVGCKTKAATERLREEREERKRAKKQRDRDGNPDAPEDDDADAAQRVATAGQFSTAGDGDYSPVDEAARAKALVDGFERHQRNPNHTRNPLASRL